MANMQQTESATSAPHRIAGIPMPQLLVIAGPITLTIILRTVNSPVTNFSSMIALALLCGSALRHPAAFLLPLLVRLTTDVIVHFTTGTGFFPSWPFDYSAYLLIFFVGRFVPSRNYFAVFGGALASVAVYFVLSNLGVWFLWPESYERSLMGLFTCFAKAVPFARGTICGNLIIAPLFFGAWNAVTATTQQPTVDASAAQEA